MGSAVGVEGKEIYGSSVSGLDLPADDEKVGPAHAWILSEHVLKTMLEVQRRRRQMVRPIVGHSPDRHLNGHESLSLTWE